MTQIWRAVLTLALVAGAVLADGNAARADHIGPAIGNGTITPGLTLVPTFQHGHLTLNILNWGVCAFVVDSTIAESEAVGQGTMQGCACVLNYRRVGALMAVGGTCTTSGVAHGVGGYFEFVPTSPAGQPVTAYALYGAVGPGITI